MKTTEWDPQRGYYTTDATFRGYDSPQSSSNDWWNLMQAKRYGGVRGAENLNQAIAAIGSSGYATDPAYSQKLAGIQARSPEQQEFLAQREAELLQAGAPLHLAQLGARQAALESAWGRSAPNGNYYGIKGSSGSRGEAMRPEELDPITMQGPWGGSEPPPLGPQPLGGPQMPPGPQMGAGGLSAPQEQPPGFMDRMMNDPMFHMGVGILSAPGYGGNWLRSVGTGMAAGQQMMAQRQAAENELFELRTKRDVAKKQQEAIKRAADGLRAQGKHQEADMLEAQLLDKSGIGRLLGLETATYGKNPQVVQRPDGKYAYAMASDTGEVKYVPIEGTPWAVAGQAPGLLREREAAKTEGKTAIEEQQAAASRYSKAVGQAEPTLSAIDELLGPERSDARSSATGWSGRIGLGALPYTDAAAWKARLQNLQSNLFMQAFEMLKGGGQITEREGQAAREALSNIDLDTMDEEAVVRELQRVRKHVTRGLEILREEAARGDARAQAALEGRYPPPQEREPLPIETAPQINPEDDPLGLRGGF
jgi:hypothetical protein